MDSRSFDSESSDALPRPQGEAPLRRPQKMEDSSSNWIEQALQRGRFERSLTSRPDPFPFPDGYEPFSREHESSPFPVRRASQPRASLRVSDSTNFAATRSGLFPSAQPRRSSSIASAIGVTASPVPSHGSGVSAPYYGATPLGSSVDVSRFSEPDMGSRDSRAGSVAPDYGDTTATFEHIYNIGCNALAPRHTPTSSILEQFPKDIFMRILMHCDYKDQIRLKRCNYRIHQSVDLELIPWMKKAAVILGEERDNPINFSKKAAKVKEDGEPASGNEVDDDAASHREAKSSTARARAKRPLQKTRPDPVTLGRWGCYTCYKILPPHYFEGPLLEDEEGRVLKQQRKQEKESVDTDKKVDMRVEYIQVLGVVPADPPPWLLDDDRPIMASDVETYVRQRMDKGPSRSDLREYYQDINKETHLMAPLRGVTPVFVESTYDLPPVGLDDSAMSNSAHTINRPKHSIAPSPSSLPFSSLSAGEIPYGCETYRPLYCQETKKALRGDTEIGRYFYEICIPHNSERGENYLKMPTSQPVGRIILPQKTSCDDTEYITRPAVEISDVIALRRICIPCGTKYGVYRRDCNRKIVSKTGEGWWVCACPRVRQTGRCRGCPDCGRRTIY